jgi:UDP-N-acetylglucosamine:LPS N-acetylglucosamine transferase
MTTPRPKILILTSSTGGGHMNLAQALKDTLSAKYEVHIVDAHPGFLHHYYSLVSRHFLGLWDLEYRFTDNEKMSLWLHRLLAVLTWKRLPMLIERMQPQLIISTHALLSYPIARAVAQLCKHIPLVFQLTDLEQTHTTWFTEKYASAYLAPTREVFAQALARDIDKSRLHITGRPVRKQFLQEFRTSRPETLAALDLNPGTFTIFLQGGAKGSAGVDRTVKSMLASEVPVQIILAVGNNQAMAARSAGIDNLRVLPFTETIAPYMAASDIIAGKVGASFLSEAIMLEKPFLVTAFIPGQEAPNLLFLERYNLGWTCLDTSLQQQLITKLASNSAMIAEKVSSIRAYKAWNMQANQNIHPVIEGLIF